MPVETTNNIPEPSECQDGTYVLSLKVLSPQEWIDLYKFREASPEEQEKASHKDIDRFTEMLLSGFESISESEYTIGSDRLILGASYSEYFKADQNVLMNKKRNFYDNETADCLRKLNKNKEKEEKKASRQTKFARKKKRIELFLEKNIKDRLRQGTDSLLFSRCVETETNIQGKKKVISFKTLKKTLAEEYDYFLKRDKKELSFQNEAPMGQQAVVTFQKPPSQKQIVRRALFGAVSHNER